MSETKAVKEVSFTDEESHLDDDEYKPVYGDCYTPRFIQSEPSSPFLVLMSVSGQQRPKTWPLYHIICVGQLSEFDPNGGGDIPIDWIKRLTAPTKEQLVFLQSNKVPYFKPLSPKV